MHDEEYLTPSQVADRFHVSVLTVRRWINSGRLVAAKAGPRRWLIRRSDVDHFLAGSGAVAARGVEPSEDASFRQHLVEPRGR